MSSGAISTTAGTLIGQTGGGIKASVAAFEAAIAGVMETARWRADRPKRAVHVGVPGKIRLVGGRPLRADREGVFVPLRSKP